MNAVTVQIDREQMQAVAHDLSNGWAKRFAGELGKALAASLPLESPKETPPLDPFTRIERHNMSNTELIDMKETYAEASGTAHDTASHDAGLRAVAEKAWDEGHAAQPTPTDVLIHGHGAVMWSVGTNPYRERP